MNKIIMVFALVFLVSLCAVTGTDEKLLVHHYNGKAAYAVEEGLFNMSVDPFKATTVDKNCDVHGHCEQIIELNNLKSGDLNVKDVTFEIPSVMENVEMWKGKWQVVEKQRRVNAELTKLIDSDCALDEGVEEEILQCVTDDGLVPCDTVQDGLCYYQGTTLETYEDYDWHYTPFNPKSMAIKNFARLKIEYDVPRKSSGEFNITMVFDEGKYKFDPYWNTSDKFCDWGGSYQHIQCSGGSVESPMSFRSIYEYFVNNPLPKNYTMPKNYLGLGEYNAELIENNSAAWTGLQGMSNATDDCSSSAFNNCSIRATVSSIPSKDETNSIYISDAYFYALVDNTANYTDPDQRYTDYMIEGTQNFDHIYLLNYVSTDTYVRFYRSKFLDKEEDHPDETGNFTVVKPLHLMFNEDQSIGRFGTTCADKIKFSAKTDSNESNPRVIGLRVHNYYGSGTDANRFRYGGAVKKDYNLTSSWQDFEIVIREDLYPSYWYEDAGDRGYWTHTKQLRMYFDGLAVNDSVWVDGLRFECSDRNPKKIGENSFVFSSPLYIYSSGYSSVFRDKGFYVQFDTLQTSASAYYPSTSYLAGLRLYGTDTSVGAIQLGDYNYSNQEHEGGTIFFNAYSREDTGSFEPNYVLAQGVTFMAPEFTYGGYYLNGDYTVFRDCNFINNLNYMGGTGHQFLGGYWSGGRYFWTGQSGVVIDDYTIYSPTSRPLWPRTYNQTLRNLKIYKNGNVIYTYDYGYTQDYDSARFINLNLIESDNAYYQATTQYSAYGNNVYIGFSFDLKLKDEDGQPIEGASVKVTNSDGDTVMDVVTNENGTFSTQDLIVLRAYTCGTGCGEASSSTYYYFNTPNDWTNHYAPFTVTIEKEGYNTYSTVLLKDGYDMDSAIVKTGVDWEISLGENSPGTISVHGTEYSSGEEGTIYAQVSYQNGTISNVADCNVSIYNRNTTWVSNQKMYYIQNSDGSYYYNFTVPSNISVFMTNVKCVNPTVYGSSDFHVGQASYTLNTINTTIHGLFNEYLNNINDTVTLINTSLEDIGTSPADIWAYNNSLQTLEGISDEQDSVFRVSLSNFDSITAGSTYYAKVMSNAFNGTPKNLSSLPKITIYDSGRNIIINNQNFNYSSQGLYTYNYTTLSTAASGVWESVVEINESGEISYLNEYWYISSTIADVVINGMSDVSVPSIVADAYIKNAGTLTSDFEYVYCIVDEETNPCGGGDDIAYQAGTRAIVAGDTWNALFGLNVATDGTYWFKLKARPLGDAENWAKASYMFTTGTEPIYSGGIAGTTSDTDNNMCVSNINCPIGYSCNHNNTCQPLVCSPNEYMDHSGHRCVDPNKIKDQTFDYVLLITAITLFFMITKKREDKE